MVETEITTVSVKGQVVIPQALREKLKLAPKTKLIVYGEGDTIIMRKLLLPDLSEEWQAIREIMKQREREFGPLTEEDVRKEVEAHRREKTEA